MLEQAEPVPVVRSADQSTAESNTGKWILLILAVIYVAGSLYLLFDLRSQANSLSKDSKAQFAELTKRVQAAEASDETLAQQVGMTKKELAARAAELQRQTRAAEARLAERQKEQISQVTGKVAGVETEVGGVKTDVASTKTDLEATKARLERTIDVASTKTDLEATKARLERTIGDLGLQSGLVAKTRDDLELLKHRGDRNYYEFTLLKGAKPQPVSTVSLQLRKADAKRGKYTMNVTADDRTIEKKDRNVNEPIQFYTGRDHLLYELVVWTADKNKVTGYLSTPKNAPVPVSANQ